MKILLLLILHVVYLAVIHTLNSPDAETKQVKCVSHVMDEIIPDGIASSDSEDGEHCYTTCSIRHTLHVTDHADHSHALYYNTVQISLLHMPALIINIILY